MSYRLCLPGSCSLAKDAAVTFSCLYGIVDWHTLSCLQETTETISQLKRKRKSYSKISKVYLLWSLLSAMKQDKLWPFRSINSTNLGRASIEQNGGFMSMVLASQSWAWWSPLPRAPGCRFSAAELLFCTGRQSWNTCHCEHLLSSHMNICEQRKNRQRVGADTIIATDLQFSKENCSFHYCHLNIDEWVQNQQRKFLVLYMYKLRVCLGNYICPFSVFFLCYCKLF